MHKFRASSLSEIMTDPVSIDASLLTPELLVISKKKVKTDSDKLELAPFWDLSLSAGAKTCVEKIAKQTIYGYEEIVTGKYMDKGIQVEGAAIELYNSVMFTSHSKNKERKTNEWITGECDIATPQKITDIKAAWSLSTFPVTANQGRDKGYEWQLRAYMMLWDVDLAELAYCLIDTPEELIGWDDPILHSVSHIQPELRITLVQYQRDKALEEKIKRKCEAANNYLAAIMQQIADEHTF